MEKAAATNLLRCVRSTARLIDATQQSDCNLLNAFTQKGDATAFAVLLRRHASLVLSACRQILNGTTDVEDAFQATFLALHQKASSIRQSQSVGSWLFSVARRAALAARRRGARRQECERQAGTDNSSGTSDPADLSWREVQSILHEEVERLPEHYRLPILHCYLEGQTREEAARYLGWTTGTLIGRLERGRKMLRGRLVKRGVSLSAALFAVLGDSVPVTASPVLVEETIRALSRGAVSADILNFFLEQSP